ncbi:quinol:cytochrome C oxidoreductase [Acidiluteibacter ferrifornacis]|nr:quinol:cytochrome C oxidoreductase [Acidiluteibacter ferrifornacis]
MDFIFTNKSKITFAIFMAIGLIALIVGMPHDAESNTRFWANILVNGFFFFGISLGTLFFLALQYATEASYLTVLKRVFEGISQYMWVGAITLIIFFAACSLHWNHIYHWMDPAATHEFVIEGTIDSAHPEYTNDATVEGAIENHHYDSIIAGKTAYLNQGFFWLRTIAYLAVWLFFVNLFRKRSLKEDQEGGTKIHFKNMVYSAIFLVFFAYTSSTASWDWLMSIDTHWFSTLFGWYVFSGIWVSAMITIVLLTLYLKSKGYLEVVNKSHMHDITKWMFAISFLWSYLWFSQFMLIWYSNIPEEVTYYMTRIEHYRGLFFGVFAVNFIMPMVILMSRDSKRSIGYALVVGIVIFIGHWLDVFLMVMPGTVGSHWHFGFLEIGTFIGFLGLFLFTVFRSLAKAPLVVKNHPFLDESKHLHI